MQDVHNEPTTKCLFPGTKCIIPCWQAETSSQRQAWTIWHTCGREPGVSGLPNSCCVWCLFLDKKNERLNQIHLRTEPYYSYVMNNYVQHTYTPSFRDMIPDIPENKEVRDFLLRAPTKGLFMPLGKEVKVMQCWRCKKFGHRTGDKECPLFLAGNPRTETTLKAAYDPMYWLSVLFRTLCEYSLRKNTTTLVFFLYLSCIRSHTRTLNVMCERVTRDLVM